MKKRISEKCIFAALLNISVFVMFVAVGCGLHNPLSADDPSSDVATAEDAEEVKMFQLSDLETEAGSGLYRLTDLVPEYEGMEIASYGMRDENEVLFIYKTARAYDEVYEWATDSSAESQETSDSSVETQEGADSSAEPQEGADSSVEPLEDTDSAAEPQEATGSDAKDDSEYDYYRFAGLNLLTGEVTEYPWNMRTGLDEYGYSRWLTAVSVNPVIMYDYSNGSVYMPESDTPEIIVQDEKISGDILYKNDKLYIVRSSGIISQINEDGSLETVYTLPDVLANMYLEKSESDDYIKVSATTYTGDSVFLDIDPNTWKDNVYQQDYYDYYISGSDDDAYFALESEGLEGPTTKLMVIESSGDCYRIDIAESEFERLNSTDYYVNLNQTAKAGKYILAALSGYDGDYDGFLLWDYKTGEKGNMVPNEKKPYEIPVLSYDDLDNRAKEIEDKYGVAVVYGENIQPSLSDFEFETYTNSGEIMKAFDTVEETLKLFPEGFFDQLEENYVRNTVIYFTGKQAPKDASINITDSYGVTSDESGLMTIFVNIVDGTLTKATLMHELTHAIDRKLIYDNALDEYRWSTYNPSDFDYYYAYIDENGNDYSESGDYIYTSYANDAYSTDYKDTYFVDVYAKTWPTEDRSRLMEYLMGYDYEDDMYHSEHMQDKLEYFFDCIRNDLGTDTWPEETSWEKKLKQIKSN